MIKVHKHIPLLLFVILMFQIIKKKNILFFSMYTDVTFIFIGVFVSQNNFT